MKKRITAILTALIMTFSLVSCGKSENSSSESKAETTVETNASDNNKNNEELCYNGEFNEKGSSPAP